MLFRKITLACDQEIDVYSREPCSDMGKRQVYEPSCSYLAFALSCCLRILAHLANSSCAEVARSSRSS